MAKVITIFVLLYSMSLPTYAMKTYQLDCPDRGIMTVLHTNYLITTLKWGSEFLYRDRLSGIARKMQDIISTIF